MSSESVELTEPSESVKMRVSEVQKVLHFDVQKWIGIVPFILICNDKDNSEVSISLPCQVLALIGLGISSPNIYT